MEYFSLKCFIEVVRTGSFSKAAHKLFRTQPAISLQIRKLEKELKQPLFDRYKKHIVLTEKGELLYEKAKDLLERLDDLKRLTCHAATEPLGPLTIATNLSLINNLLPPVIGEFHKKYPQVKVILLNLKSKDISMAILEGNADLGIGYLLKNHPEITPVKIKSAHFLLVNKKGLLEKLSIKDAFGEKFVHFEAGTELRSYIEKHLEIKPALSIPMELPSIESILHYVEQGLGFSILPDFSIANHWGKKIGIKQLQHLIPPIDICAYKHQKRILPKAAEKFLEILRKK